jgi:MFS family permease
MSRMKNGKVLTRRTYDLVRAEPHLKRWSIRAGVWGLLLGAIGVIPGFLLIAVSGVAEEVDANSTAAADANVGLLIAGGALVVVGFLLGTVAANLQIAAMVSAADDVLHGRPVDEDASRDAARGRFGAIVGWGVISVVVGLIIGAIRGNGEGGVASSIMRSLAAGVAAAAWSIITFFALPVIVLEHLGAASAVKRSAGIVKATWGETISGSVRIGLRFALLYTLPGLALLIGGIVLAVAVGGPAVVAGVVLGLVGIGLLLWGAVLATTCRTVFGVALYRWANGDGALGPFSDDDLRGAVATKA